MSNNWQNQIPGNNAGEKKQSQTQRTVNNSLIKTSGGFGIKKILSDYSDGGETFEAFMELAQAGVEKVKQQLPNSNFSVHRIMKSDYALNYSGIVIANKQGGIVVYHLLLIEVTGDTPMPMIRDFGGESYTILRTPAHALDEKYISVVQHVLSTSLGVEKSALRTVDGLLVPKEFNATDQHNVERVLSESFNAVYSETLVLVEDFVGESLGEFNRHRDARFALDVNFHNSGDMHHDSTGTLIRKDIVIRLSTKIGNHTSNSVNQGDVGEELLRIYGYVDFEYQIPRPQQGYGPTTQCFMPNFIVTSFETDRAVMTPHLLVMGLASLVSISEDMTWVKYFLDQSPVKGKEINLNDIGMLNIQGNLSNNTSGFDEPFKTNDPSLGPNGIWNYINLLVKPKMMISIDIPACGSNTWFLSIFKHIANGKPQVSARARSRITEAVNVLVGGGFVDANVPMFISNTNKIHGGFYVEKGEMFDIRRASSYLAYAAYVKATNQTPELIRRYVSTYQNESVPVEIRAAERGKMVSEMVGNRMEVKQFYDRLTFSAHWLNMLVETLQAGGFRPVPENIRGGQDVFQQRGFDYDAAGISPGLRVTGRNDMFGGFHTTYQPYGRQF